MIFGRRNCRPIPAAGEENDDANVKR